LILMVLFLNRFEILHYFTHLATAEDVEHVKPNPDLYLNVLEKMNLEPSHVIRLRIHRRDYWLPKELESIA